MYRYIHTEIYMCVYLLSAVAAYLAWNIRDPGPQRGSPARAGIPGLAPRPQLWDGGLHLYLSTEFHVGTTK